ncbi:hypothetical protein [Myceligenerans cantabricum]
MYSRHFLASTTLVIAILGAVLTGAAAGATEHAIGFSTASCVGCWTPG